MTHTTRWFVRNIPSECSEEDFSHYFKRLGNISNVVLSKKPQGVIAHFNVEGSSSKVEKKVQELSGKIWNGYQIIIEPARESFMTRLQKERETSKINNSGELTELPLKSTDVITNGNLEKNKSSSVENDDILKSFERYDDSWNDKDEENRLTMKNSENKKKEKKKKKADNVSNNGLSTDKEDVKNGIPKFKGLKTLELKFDNEPSMETLNGLNLNKYKKSKEREKNKNDLKVTENLVPLTKTEKKYRDDERRRKSLLDKVNQRKNQQALVTSALTDTISCKNKKIIFNDDGKADESERPSKKAKLFDSDDENAETTIEIKERFTGEKGLKLLKLQSSYQNDERFKLDERFLDDEDKDLEDTQKLRTTSMQRFTEEVLLPSVKSLTSSAKAQNGKVSEGKFYEVSQSLSLGSNNTGFSLLQMYGDKGFKKENGEKDSFKANEGIRKLKVRNPLLDDEDSSDEEPEPIPKIVDEKLTSKFSCTRDSFFYCANDPRFQEGYLFMNKKNSEEFRNSVENYDTIRRLLKKVFHAQTMKRSSKTAMFKKKVGGMHKKQTKNNLVSNKLKKVKRKSKVKQ